jgi:hypothetical protein
MHTQTPREAEDDLAKLVVMHRPSLSRTPLQSHPGCPPASLPTSLSHGLPTQRHTSVSHLKPNAPNSLATQSHQLPYTGHHTDHSRQARRRHEALQASPAPGPECRVTCSEAPSC